MHNFGRRRQAKIPSKSWKTILHTRCHVIAKRINIKKSLGFILPTKIQMFRREGETTTFRASTFYKSNIRPYTIFYSLYALADESCNQKLFELNSPKF